ncbi:hypothetical protein EVAR_43299_1 [Eumeta japonica]|uniref:Circadian clock-controlled protein n=1 Tax=Eumeta variegata TaxID=151549 RepID=A0A4C1WZS7_EUMVA|nr:hypothetical protein EVAR_43299_1 [Eumeta japonica]
MDKRYSALVIVLLLVGAEASALSKHPLLLLKLQQEKWDGLGQTATINEYVDETIGLLVPFMQQNGLDPMDLPEIVEGFEVKPLLITYSAWLKIHDGYMTGLVSAARDGDQQVSYFAKMARVRLNIQFTDLEFVYKYLVQVMNIGPTGGIVGSLERFTVVIDLIVDFNNDEVQLQEFTLRDIGRLRVRLTGNILVDWLVNPVISVFMRLFDTIIMRVVVSNVQSGVQDVIDIINRGVKEILDHLETINNY